MSEAKENPYEVPVVNNENPDEYAKIIQQAKNTAAKIGIIVSAPFFIGTIFAAANRQYFLALHLPIAGITLGASAALYPFLHALKKILCVRNAEIRINLNEFSVRVENIINKMDK